ncbi:SurA N-terminal domain-containing protein, partial [Patescibacteria group bacterium]|nr:SurA N-terminal domain-containing protein [Patescibacteria group bacterium]
IAAVVNGQPISRISVVSELENRNGKSVLNEFVINSLIEQEAKRKKINVSDKEVSDELVKIEQSVNSQGATLDDLLAQQGMTKDSLKSAVKVQLLATKLVNNNIKVTDKEINDYINTQKAQLTAAGGTSGSLPSRDQAKSDLVQQKLQSEIQTLITDLKNKAKISYFVGY